jgi:hypothetical protein
MQLVAYGAQDVYLTGNPEITFFKVVYRRHTNFACEAIEQTFSGTADFGRKVSCPINRNGDLITKVHLKATVSAVSTIGTDTRFAWVEKLGHAIIKEVEVNIGGSRIDRQYGDWLNIWQELTRDNSHDRGYNKMIGNVSDMTSLEASSGDCKDAYTMYVPLQFWFCRNNGLALPLIALQYHDVRVDFQFRDLAECVVTSNVTASQLKSAGIKFDDATLLVDYIYLDSEERKRFAQASHEYLIEQVQDVDKNITATSEKIRLNYNHPTKGIYFGMKLGNYTTGKAYLAYNANDWAAAKDEFAILVHLNCIKHFDNGHMELDSDVSGNEAEASGNASGNTGTPRYVQDANLPAKLKALKAKCAVELAFTVGDTEMDVKSNTGMFVVTSNTLTWKDVSTTSAKVFASAPSAYSRPAHLELLDVDVYQHCNYGLYINGEGNPVSEGQIKLNGHERFSKRDGLYFNYVQAHSHHSNSPSDGVCAYNFALNPEEHQPSGSCNFSRIDIAELHLWFAEPGAAKSGDFKADFLDDDTTMWVYGLNYNVLRVMSGMAGTAYSN